MISIGKWKIPYMAFYLFMGSSYIAGIIGFLTPMVSWFKYLTGFHNILIVVGLWISHPIINRSSWSKFIIPIFIWGLLVEIIGVNTGLIFGNYSYGDVLGPKVFSTPLLIGVNWVLMTYFCGNVINRFFPDINHPISFMVLGSILMTLYDILIEPFAIEYGLWQWEFITPPLHNYLGWFFVSLPAMYYFKRIFRNDINQAALILFVFQLIFFSILVLNTKL
jgi:bisanhydrobacterioruberin hydratase